MEPVPALAPGAGSLAVVRTYARRASLLLWLGMSVVGALNFNLLEERFFRHGGALTAVLPHLRFGHVMFDRVPSNITVPSVTFADGVHHGLSSVLVTDSIGYEDARGYLGFALDPDWERRICGRIESRPDVTLWLRQIAITDAPRVKSARAIRCDRGAAP
jgi:hypothetical protein